MSGYLKMKPVPVSDGRRICVTERGGDLSLYLGASLCFVLWLLVRFPMSTISTHKIRVSRGYA